MQSIKIPMKKNLKLNSQSIKKITIFNIELKSDVKIDDKFLNVIDIDTPK